MYLARLVPGESPQIYPLDGALYFPRAWEFCSYLRGACAIDATPVLAVRRARKHLRVMQLQRIFSGENAVIGTVRSANAI